MRKRIFIPLFVIVISAIFTSFSYSQSDSKQHFYEMNFLQISYDQMSEFTELYETYGKPIDAQNEYILSVKFFRHFSGPVWSVCILTEYKDLEGFAASQKRSDELWSKAYPDKSKQDELWKKWGQFMKGHTDALVTNNPKLEK
jgi:hypothetical protein